MTNMETMMTSIECVYQKLDELGYTQSTIKMYRMIYNGIIKFMTNQEIDILNENVCLAYLYYRTGYKKEGFYGKGNKKINRVLKPLEVLIHYMDTGEISYHMRDKLPPYDCPKQFRNEYSGVQEQLVERHAAPATIKSYLQKIRKFLTFLDAASIESSEKISANEISAFIQLYDSNKPKYVATIITVIRNYLIFLYLTGYTSENKSTLLPRIRLMRNAFIPYVWNRQDVRKLLGIIDREDPKGKRDYAIILLVTRLGLRASDVRNLKLSNIDWQRKVIVMNMTKTKEGIELPLLDDIGWAIIDYLQNGRPKTDCNRVFVRHRAPHGPVGENETFYRELHRYMVVADIRIPVEYHCGLHSLRSTLARNMLESGVALPIISETLGHKSIHTTSIYLKIDLNGLRKCALNPEAVLIP